jgi:hypothetical protein
VSIADPRKQLEIISARTDELKRSKQAVGASVLTQMADMGRPRRSSPSRDATSRGSCRSTWW